MNRFRPVWCAVLFAATPPAIQAQAMPPADARRLEREILAELIAINTSDSGAGVPRAARAMADRLLAAGLPAADVRVIGHTPQYQNVVARYRGRDTGKKPILLMAHLDVVDARREDWSTDPYALVEKDGWYYGRGTNDNKAGVVTLIAALIRYRREGFVPDRDLIVVLTGDEETTSGGITWLLREQRALVDGEYALNTDAGGGAYENGKPVAFAVQASEKMYLTFTLEVRNPGGHSSVPMPDNAIYRLSRGLGRLAEHRFPVRLNEVSRAYFERTAPAQTGQVAADLRALARTGDPAAANRLSAAYPYFNSVMRTTCVATRLLGGHADNALPQLARATLNCRLAPGHPADSVEAALRAIVADTAVHLTRAAEPTPSPPSPLRADVLEPIEALVRRMWPGVPVIPEMSTGATDGLYVRNAGIPVYGVSAIFDDINDVRAHGRDERVGVKEFHQAAEFWYLLVKRLAAPPAS